MKQELEKFVQALALIKTDDRWSMGLITNRSGEEIDWQKKLGQKVSRVEVTEDKSDRELTEEIRTVLIGDKWLVLDLKTTITNEIYKMLRLLSMSNRLQIIGQSEIENIKQSDKTRVVVTGINEIISKIGENYPDFTKLFGLSMDI